MYEPVIRLSDDCTVRFSFVRLGMRVATSEGGYEALPETTVHKTVSDWITAGGRVSQKLDVRFCHAG